MELKDQAKKLAGEHAISFLEPGMTIGIGTGTTVYWFIEALAKKVTQGFQCVGVPTSTASDQLAKKLGIPMTVLNEVDKIDITIDGADEIDPQLNLIKGGGAALLQEKMVAAASSQEIIIADSSKLVQTLGVFPLPVEVIPDGWKQVQRQFQQRYNITAEPRMKDGKILITDHGHYILDCYFNAISNPAQLSIELNMTPGVVENGLFVKMASSAIIAYPDGQIKLIEPVSKQ